MGKKSEEIFKAARYRVVLVLYGVTIALTPVASAQDVVPTAPPTGAIEANGVPEVPAVVVKERADSLIGIAESASDGVVGKEQIERRPLLRPGEILETVPGLIITQHSGAGKANQFFLRGFNLDHGTDFATSVAGIPVNLPSHGHGQGYTDLNFMIPELVDTVSFKKGPYHARNGDFSSAGSADIEYVDSLPYTLARIEGGMFEYGRAVVAGSPRVGGGNLLYGLEAFHNDGPWDKPDDYDKFNGVVRFDHGDDSRGFDVTAMGYHGEWDATDQVAKRALSELPDFNRWDSLDETTGGTSERYSLAGRYHALGARAAMELELYAFYYELNLFSNFTYFLDDPINGDQFEQADERWVTGGEGSYTRFATLLDFPSDFTFGVQLRNDAIENGLYSTLARDRLSTTRRDDINQTSIGLYLQNETRWHEKFRSVSGLRVDTYGFDVDSNLSANSGNDWDAIVSPKLNLIFGPWAQTEVYASGSLGFHSNDARGVTTTVDPLTGDPVEKADPLVQTTGAELGVRTLKIPNLQSTAVFWWLDIDSELLFIGDAGTTEASRPSRRYGLELASYYTPYPWLTFDTDFSISHTRFRDDELEGEHIPGSVGIVLASGVSINDLRGFSASLRARYFGKRPLIEDNSVRSEPTTLVNAAVGYAFNPTWTVGVDIFNLFDADENDIEYYYASRLDGEPAEGVEDRHIHPAEPLTVRAGLTARF